MMNVDGSILTNAGKKTALNVLNDIKSDKSETQSRISTGKEVRMAKDNPATFVVSETMKNDVAAFKQLEENIGLNQTIVNQAAEGVDSIGEHIKTMREKVEAAANPANPNEDVQQDIDQLKNQISSVVQASQFKGVNLINDEGSTDFLMSIDRTSDGVEGNQIEVQKQSMEISENGGLSALNNLTVEGPGTVNNGDALTAPSPTSAMTASITGLTLDAVAEGQTISLKGISNASTSGGTVTLRFTNGEFGGPSTNGTTIGGNSMEIAVTTASVTNASDLAGQIESALNTALTGFTTSGTPSDSQLQIGTNGSTAIQIKQTGSSTTATLSNIESGFKFDTVLNRVESAMQSQLDAASELGSVQQRLNDQSNFVNKLRDTTDTGVGQLVDANMAEEAARLQALQAQEQLANQSLSIANRQPQSLIGLFGG